MNISKHQKGFTLVEMVVALSIIVILTGIFLASYYSENATRAVTDTALLIAQNVRKAQDLSLVQSPMPTNCGDNWPKGFSVYFTTSKINDKFYIDIFGDKNNYGNYNLSGTDCVCTGTNECVERQFLPLNVKISKIKIGEAGSECSSAWINFFLSDTTVQIKNGCSITDNSKIEIELSPAYGSGEKKTIVINNKGMIEIK